MKKIYDLTNMSFGELKVLNPVSKEMFYNSEWICVCSCEKQVIKKASSLIYGQVRSCGHIKGNNRHLKNEYFTNNDIAEIHITNKKNKIFIIKIDSKYVDICKKYNWVISTSGYAMSIDNKRNEICYMHKLICSFNEDIENKLVDHINGDTYDNREKNLRSCNHQENCRNSRNRKNVSQTNLIGVRKDIRCKNSWRAQIFIDKNNKIEKTYKDKELAIIQRLIWELQFFGEFSPQLELIKSNYNSLLGYFQIKDKMKFSDDIELIKNICDELNINPHCPCLLNKTSDTTICPCLPCRNVQKCCCGLYVPIESIKKEIPNE